MAEMTIDPQLQDLLNRVPDGVADTFSPTQIQGLTRAVNTRGWGKHALNIRGSVPLFAHRYYFAIFAGRNRREMSAKERLLDNVFALFFFLGFLMFCMTCGAIALYLVKSALGIDFFSDYSFGLWHCVRDNVF